MTFWALTLLISFRKRLLVFLILQSPRVLLSFLASLLPLSFKAKLKKKNPQETKKQKYKYQNAFPYGRINIQLCHLQELNNINKNKPSNFHS